MKRRKQFVSPKVVQAVEVQLENDLLQGPSTRGNTEAIIMGQEVEEHDFSDFDDSYWE